jgi:hypothetical protein
VCTSMVTQIAMNLGCLEMANLSYIEGDVPILALDPCAHLARETQSFFIYAIWSRGVPVA